MRSRSFVTIKQRARRSDLTGGESGPLSLDISDLPRFNEKKPRRLLWSKVNRQKLTHTGNPAIAFWLTLMVGTLLNFSNGVSDLIFGTTSRFLGVGNFTAGGELKPTNQGRHSHRPKMFQLDFMQHLSKSREQPDFGGLVIHNRTVFDEPIGIRSGDYKAASKSRAKFLKSIDTTLDIYSPESSKEDENPVCKKVSWTKKPFPVCNQIHENSIERFVDDGEYAVSYLSSGTFRDAFRFRKIRHPSDHFVMKKAMMWNKISDFEIGMVRKEALILERLAASPRVLNIYGHCGLSVLIEPMASELDEVIIGGDGEASQKELDALDDVYPRNNLTISEKLQISLDMAESIADLHGFEGGPIIHGDVHIEQWLISPDRSIKLNDFNNAIEPKWDEKKGAFCDNQGRWGSVNRSPEEYSNGLQDESVDTYAYGNNIYTLLTGLWYFYDEEYNDIPEKQTRKDIVAGKTPFVDPRYRSRSFVEARLVEIMERCWAYDRTKRPSIFEVVSFLRDTVLEAKKRGDLVGASSDIIKVTL